MTMTALVAALAATACTRPDRFGGAGGAGGAGADGLAGLPGGAGVGTAGLGGPGDPTSPEYFQQSVGDRVFFAVDQSTLSPAAVATLDGQAQWLLSNAGTLAIIEGHADEQGTREYNVAWARAAPTPRASTSCRRGVPRDRLRTVSYGKERPVAACSEASCYDQNRRAVTVISLAGTA
jgi:peptidoglycan-associated lipoprotein